MDCVLFASPVHIVTAWPIAPQKQGYNIVWGGAFQTTMRYYQYILF